MARLLTILSLAAMLYMAVAQTATVIPVTPSTALTSSMVQTSSMAPTSSAMPSPTATPVPPIPEPTENNYFINSSNTTVCLHMKAGLTIEFKYLVGSENRTIDLDLDTKEVDTRDSSCNATDLTASLKLKYTHKNGRIYNLTFEFDGNQTTKHWNVSSIIVEFMYNETDFPGYTGKDPSPIDVNSTSFGPLFDNGPVSLKSSFGCNVNKTLSNFDKVTEDLHVSLFMMDLQVQAFEFNNNKTGAFDSGVLCSEANTGNKIVPIAVGAALAGLVIVVLIAYLIGRLRNRKKSSYEALS